MPRYSGSIPIPVLTLGYWYGYSIEVYISRPKTCTIGYLQAQATLAKEISYLLMVFAWLNDGE